MNTKDIEELLEDARNCILHHVQSDDLDQADLKFLLQVCGLWFNGPESRRVIGCLVDALYEEYYGEDCEEEE